MSLNRRNFLYKSSLLGVTGLASYSLLNIASCKEKEDDIGPTEDLMREHGVLNRVLLVYDHFIQDLSQSNKANTRLLFDSASIINVFIEDYHEKQEEDYVFPRFEKVNKLTDLVATLRTQHKNGRDITCRLLQITKTNVAENDVIKLTALRLDFIRMYRPHEARKDTILFPALHQIVSKHEFNSMGEDFEKREHKLFGQDGFQEYLDKITYIEKQLDLFELSKFTPRATICND
jgi:hypothetical protein